MRGWGAGDLSSRDWTVVSWDAPRGKLNVGAAGGWLQLSVPCPTPPRCKPITPRGPHTPAPQAAAAPPPAVAPEEESELDHELEQLRRQLVEVGPRLDAGRANGNPEAAWGDCHATAGGSRPRLPPRPRFALLLLSTCGPRHTLMCPPSDQGGLPEPAAAPARAQPRLGGSRCGGLARMCRRRAAGVRQRSRRPPAAAMPHASHPRLRPSLNQPWLPRFQAPHNSIVCPQ
jgi:hypothetical protein